MSSPLAELAALVAPPRCAGCGEPVGPDEPVCRGCRIALRAGPPSLGPGPPGIRLAVAACGFDGTARAVVHGLKYGRRLALAEVAAEAIVAACPPDELHGTVVPVPASPLRWRWRGFDPAEEIALALARRVELAYLCCLRRAQGPRQVGRSRARRESDPPRVRAVARVPGRALLVDDVRTTGATLASCAGALRGAGAEEVVALTLAYVCGNPLAGRPAEA